MILLQNQQEADVVADRLSHIQFEDSLVLVFFPLCYPMESFVEIYDSIAANEGTSLSSRYALLYHLTATLCK